MVFACTLVLAAHDCTVIWSAVKCPAVLALTLNQDGMAVLGLFKHSWEYWLLSHELAHNTFTECCTMSNSP